MNFLILPKFVDKKITRITSTNSLSQTQRQYYIENNHIGFPEHKHTHLTITHQYLLYLQLIWNCPEGY